MGAVCKAQPLLAIRIAAIDIGTNTAKLLVADKPADGRLQVVAERVLMIRLGEGVDATRSLSTAALHRLREALLSFKAESRRLGADRIVAVGTSASRDIRDQSSLVTWVKEHTGLDYTILSGAEEAEWGYRGATAYLPVGHGPCVTLDIGGGSTEIVAGIPGALARYSLDIGSVRLRERFFERLPPTAHAVARATAVVRSQLEGIVLPPSYPLIGASLTQRLLLTLDQTEARLSQTTLPRLTAQAVRAWHDRLLLMTRKEVLALNPRLLAGRDDVFAGAVLILDGVMRHFGYAHSSVSRWDLRHGLALRHAHASGTTDSSKGS